MNLTSYMMMNAFGDSIGRRSTLFDRQIPYSDCPKLGKGPSKCIEWLNLHWRDLLLVATGIPYIFQYLI